MKKRSSRLLAALLAAGMTFSMVACGSTNEPASSSESASKVETSESTASTESSTVVEEKLYYNETGYPICDEPITITVSGKQGTTKDWENTLFVKTVEEKLGIKMDCNPIADDAFTTQYALMLSTNEIPDLIITGNMDGDKSQVNLDGEAGYWLDFSQYLDIMPNFVAMMEKYPEWAAYLKTETGAIYGLSSVSPGIVTNSPGQIYFHPEVVEAAGVDVENINTIDDFYNALVAVKAKYPDKIPLSITFDKMPAYNADIILRTAFGINYHDNSYMLVADDAGKVSLADISDNNREYLKWLNKLYDEGLLDPNGTIYTSSEYRAMEDNNDFIFFADTSMRRVQNVKYNDQTGFACITALSSEYTNGEKNYVVRNGVSSGAWIYASADTEYPEAICRLVDYLCTEEGQYLAVWGIEGETYEFVDDGYGNKILSQDKFADLKKYENKTEWWQQEVAIYQGFPLLWNFTDTYLDDADVATLEKMAADPACSTGWRAKVSLSLKDNNLITQPAPLIYTSEETAERSAIYTDLITYLKTAKVSFVTGEFDANDDKAWENHVNTVKGMGYDRLMEIEQAAWDRMVAGSK